MNCKFPEIISTLRRAKGISQKQAAAELGIKQALLSHYENGIRECGLDFLIKLSEYYEVTTDELLGVCHSNSEALPKEAVAAFKKIMKEAERALGTQGEKTPLK